MAKSLLAPEVSSAEFTLSMAQKGQSLMNFDVGDLKPMLWFKIVPSEQDQDVLLLQQFSLDLIHFAERVSDAGLPGFATLSKCSSADKVAKYRIVDDGSTDCMGLSLQVVDDFCEVRRGLLAGASVNLLQLPANLHQECELTPGSRWAGFYDNKPEGLFPGQSVELSIAAHGGWIEISNPGVFIQRFVTVQSTSPGVKGTVLMRSVGSLTGSQNSCDELADTRADYKLVFADDCSSFTVESGTDPCLARHRRLIGMKLERKV